MRPGPTFFILIETIGILSFAINAILAGRKKDLSTFGIFVVAAVTALGGGTLRDILLGPAAQPFFWIANPFYIVAIFALAVGYCRLGAVRAILDRRDVFLKETAEVIAFASLGALGAVKAYAILVPGMGEGMLPVLHVLLLSAFFGAMGAAFGSVIRDMIIGDFPGALRPGVGTLEAAFIGSAAAAGLRLADVPQPWALLAGFVVIGAIRAAIVVNLHAAKA